MRLLARPPHRLTAVAAVAVLAAGLGGLGALARPGDAGPAPTARVVAADARDDCADVLVLALRGSGQAGTNAEPAGAALTPVLDRWAADAARDGLTTTVSVLGDGAAPPQVLRGDVRHAAGQPASRVVGKPAVRTWEAAVRGLVGTAADALHAAVTACPAQVVLLTGYGQGASAAHRLLLATSAAPDLDGRLAGAVLVGDGDRAAGTGATRRGAPAAPASARGLHALLRSTVADVPVRDRYQAVWSVCTAGDLVCDLGPTAFATAVARHRSYATGTGATRLAGAADAAWARTARWVRLVPDQQLGGAVGAAMDQPIEVRIADGDRSRLAFSGATGLPDGVQLTPEGHLVGTPTQGGSFQVGYTVATTRPGVTRSLDGVLTLLVADVAPTTISAGGQHTCAVQRDDSLWCWGRNANGQLGDGTRTGSSQPVAVLGDHAWRTVAAGGGSTCGIDRDGALWCWGVNNRGQLGDGSRTTRLEPERVGRAADWRQVSAGWFGACGVREDRTAWCWGDNTNHQVAPGTSRVVARPTQVPGTDWRQLAVGGWNVCGTKVDGTLWCWGRNTFGQDGVGPRLQVDAPTQVGTATDWRSVAASWSHTCGVRTSGDVYCFGRNADGQVGDGSTRQRVFPQPIGGLPPVSDVAVGAFGTCAIASGDGALWCWGSDRYGFLGDGADAARGPFARTSPVPVRTGASLSAVTAGWLHACGLDVSGAAVCWGDGEDGQLGDGTTADAPTPTAARWP